MKIPAKRFSAWTCGLFLAFTAAVSAHAEGLVPSPIPTPRQLGMTGEFVVAASNGLIQVKRDGSGHWSRTKIPVKGALLDTRIAEARDRGEPVIDLASFDLISASRRVDSLRLLDETAWSALSMIVAFQLDSSLAKGLYRYILVSDGDRHVLLDRASSGDERIRLRTYRRAAGETQATFLKHRGLPAKGGYAFTVPELAASKSGSDHLLLRLENEAVTRSALLERLVARHGSGRV